MKKMDSNFRMTVHMDSVYIGGSKVCTHSFGELLTRLDETLSLGHPSLLVTLNVDMIVRAKNSGRFRSTIASASILTLDGVPLVWLARVMGARRARRLTGADLLIQVARQVEERGWVVAMTGSSPEAAQLAASKLRKSSNTQNIYNIDFPVLESPDDPASRKVIDALWELRPTITFLCLGSPKQEYWFKTWESELPPGIFIGAGAALDFVAGIQKRAPKFLQVAGLEWAFRLARNPRRLTKRYLVDGPRFIHFLATSVASQD